LQAKKLHEFKGKKKKDERNKIMPPNLPEMSMLILKVSFCAVASVLANTWHSSLSGDGWGGKENFSS